MATGVSARQAAVVRKAEREVAAFGDRLAEAGFVRDEQRPDLFVRTERDAELGQGCIALWNRVLDEPVRWQVEPMFGWRLPEVDAVRAEVDGPRRSLDPTIVESLFVAKYPELRHSGDDTSEFRPGSDPGRSLRIWTGLAVEGWPWWSGQFSDLDSFFDYLHLTLLGGLRNLQTGYILALLTERPEMATDFVRHMFRPKMGRLGTGTRLRQPGGRAVPLRRRDRRPDTAAARVRPTERRRRLHRPMAGPGAPPTHRAGSITPTRKEDPPCPP